MKLEFDQKTKLTDILEKIRSSTESSLELSLPSDSLLAANSINKEIIKRFASDVGKEVSFSSAAPAVAKDELGFVEGEDVSSLPHQEPAEAALPIVGTASEASDKKTFSKISLPNFAFLQKIPRIYLAAGGLALILIFAFFLFLWVLPSVDVTLFYEASTKSASSELTASVGAELDANKKTVPATTEEVSKNDLATAKATGKKNVGEAAKGRVTINNYLDSDRFFSKGAVITPTSGGITFTLDNDVTASASAGFGNHTEVGVNVTATKTGPEGNLAAGTNFKIGSANTSQLFARNDTALSGGSTKTITIVSEADRNSLKDQLVAQLTKKATDEIKSQNKDVVIPEAGVEVTVSKETYDVDVGQEAAEVSLSLEVTAKAVVLKFADLVSILTKTMAVPEGFKVSEKDSSATASFLTKTTESNWRIQGKINAVLVPDVNLEKISKDLSGKRVGSAKEYLDGLKAIKSYSLKFRPSFYSAIGFLPFSTSKIHVKVEKSQ